MAYFALEPRRFDWRDRIIPIMARERMPMCANKIARKLGWDRANDKMYKALRAMLAEGLILSPVEGLYALPQSQKGAQAKKA